MTTNTPPCEVGWGGQGWDDAAAATVDEPGIGWGGQGWAEPGSGVAPVPVVVPPEGLLTTLLTGLGSHWLLGEASGAARVDSHGVEDLANNGTVGQVAGPLGTDKAASFDANVANYLSVATNPNIDVGDFDWSYSLWFNLTDLATYILLSQLQQGQPGFEFFYYAGDSRFHFDVVGAGGAVLATAIANTFGAPTAGVWYMAIIEYKTSNKAVSVRINAGAKDTVTATGASVASAVALEVGRRLWSGGGAGVQFPLKGAVAYLSRYNKILTDDEATSLYGGGTPNVYPFLSGAALDTTVNATDSGAQNIQLRIPNNHAVGASYPIVIYHHGQGESQTAITADALKQGVVRNLLGNGYVVCGSNQHGDDWGNLAGLTDIRNLYNYAAANYTLSGRAIHFGQSAGGPSSLLCCTADFVTIPGTKGWFGIYPATDLAWCYANGFTADINAAYNIPGGGTYAVQTAGHDPDLLAAAKFTGLRMRFYASAGDGTISKVDNSDAMAALVNGQATENAVIACTGAHGDPSHFRPTDVSAFAARCV